MCLYSPQPDDTHNLHAECMAGRLHVDVQPTTGAEACPGRRHLRWPSPGGAHAEARAAGRLGPQRRLVDLIQIQQLLRLEARPLPPGAALGAVAAVLRTAARLDAQQRAPLNLRRSSAGNPSQTQLELDCCKVATTNHIQALQPHWRLPDRDGLFVSVCRTTRYENAVQKQLRRRIYRPSQVLAFTHPSASCEQRRAQGSIEHALYSE